MLRWLKVGAVGAGGLLLLMGGALSAVYSMQPDHFRISRSRTIPAPASAIRPRITDVRELNAWLATAAPHLRVVTVTFSAVSTGVGAWVDRKDSEGTSRLTITEVSDSGVRYEGESVGQLGTAHSSLELLLAEKVPGTTEVEYVITGELTGLPRLLWGVVGLEARAGPEFDKALQRLEAKCIP